MSGEQSVPDGGPAFPLASPHGLFTNGGMSLRDYFAGQALSGIMSGSSRTNFEIVSKEAYKLADHMLARRGNTP